MRSCVTCGLEKEDINFYKRGKTSYRTSCKDCWNNQTKEWVFKNPDRRKQIVKKYDDSNREFLNERARKRRLEDPNHSMWMAAKNRAQKGGLPFTIEVEDIIIPENCPCFGFPLVMHTRQYGGSFNSPSLDKINPTLGYVKGNIQVISHLANVMKASATEEQLIIFAKWILEQHDTSLHNS